MSVEHGDDLATARRRLLELLEADDWEIGNRARREGKAALKKLFNREPTDWDLVEYVISLLEGDTILRCAPQGDPPGSTGVAWQMTDANNVFVKLRIDGGFGHRKSKEYVYIQSVHESDHAR